MHQEKGSTGRSPLVLAGLGTLPSGMEICVSREQAKRKSERV